MHALANLINSLMAALLVVGIYQTITGPHSAWPVAIVLPAIVWLAIFAAELLEDD